MQSCCVPCSAARRPCPLPGLERDGPELGGLITLAIGKYLPSSHFQCQALTAHSGHTEREGWPALQRGHVLTNPIPDCCLSTLWAATGSCNPEVLGGYPPFTQAGKMVLGSPWHPTESPRTSPSMTLTGSPNKVALPSRNIASLRVTSPPGSTAGSGAGWLLPGHLSAPQMRDAPLSTHESQVHTGVSPLIGMMCQRGGSNQCQRARVVQARRGLGAGFTCSWKLRVALAVLVPTDSIFRAMRPPSSA